MPGEHFRVQTLAFNLLARYPGETFQPYVGIGPALMLADINDIAKQQVAGAIGVSDECHVNSGGKKA